MGDPKENDLLPPFSKTLNDSETDIDSDCSTHNIIEDRKFKFEEAKREEFMNNFNHYKSEPRT